MENELGEILKLCAPRTPATAPARARLSARPMCTVPTDARCGSAPRVRRRLQSRAEDIARDSGELGQEATTELMDKLEGQMGQLIELQHEVRDRQYRQYRHRQRRRRRRLATGAGAVK